MFRAAVKSRLSFLRQTGGVAVTIGVGALRFGLASEANLRGVATRLRPRGRAILAAALIFAAAGMLSQDGLAKLTFALTALVLGAAATWVWYRVWCADRADRAAWRAARMFCEHDPVPAVLTGDDMALVYANPAARAAFAAEGEITLTGLLEGEIAGATATLRDMAGTARARGSARRTLPGGGGRLTLTACRTGEGMCLWRIDSDAGPPPAAPDLAVPALRFTAADTAPVANPAARQLFGWADENAIPPELGDGIVTGQIVGVGTPGGRLPCLAAAWPHGDGGRDLFLFPADPAAKELADGWTLFAALPVPLLKLARDGRILLSNPPARALLGIDSCEGRRLSDLIQGPGRPLADWLDDAAAGRGTVKAEIVPLRRDDRDRFVQVALTPAADDGESVLIAVLHDATQLKSLEAQFAQSQKMQAIGQLAGGVAHDFNNLLTAISGYCDLLLLRHGPDDADHADLKQISQNANRAAALVSQLLAYSRKQTLRPEVIDPREILLDLTHLLNRLVGEKVTLSLGHEPRLWPVRADRRQLEQVLVNLVVNARDAMPEGGEIRITTANRLLTEPLRRDRAVVAPGRYVELTVADEGVGISPGHLRKVFEPFFTTKRPGEGTGLGLSTVYGILKQTGGFIFVDSAPGEGTRIMLLLPAHDRDTATAPRPDAAPSPAARGRSDGVVLLVEDEAPVRAFAGRALRMRGLSVLEAASAEEAMEILEDDALRIDVFVSDVIMPGMDGPGWVREALKRRPGTPVVFMSGYAPEHFGGADDGMDDATFLPKPFSLQELTATVQRKLPG